MSHHEADHGKVPRKKGPDAAKESQKSSQHARAPGRGSRSTESPTEGQRTGTRESESADKSQH